MIKKSGRTHPETMLSEARRVLKSKVSLVIGFIDRDSMIGQRYLTHQGESVFYREARFYSALEVAKLFVETGFVDFAWTQRLVHPLNEIQEIEPLRNGYGNASLSWSRRFDLDIRW